jgi:lantibiotic biosynthesis protein
MSSWRPILTGPLADRAWEAVEEIAQVLAPAPAGAEVSAGAEIAAGSEASAAEARPGASHFPGVAGGTAGQALFFAYRSRSSRANALDAEAAGTLLDDATGALATTPLAPDLYGGFAGVAWAAEHLYSPRFADAAESAGSAGDDGGRAAPEAPGDAPAPDRAAAETSAEDDPLAEIDDALLRYLDHSPWQADYDLIRGLTGLGVYALERLPRPSALQCLGKIVERLAENAESGPQGITWHTAPELLPDWQRKLFPTGYYNLGVAHGVPGTIAVLAATARATARLAAAGEPRAREVAESARDLASGAVRWLIAQRLPAAEESWFGASFSPEVPAARSRLAWCYGDPGIAAALLVAARACGEAEWERFAIELALDTAARSTAGSLVRDAGLCHGSAGLAHLFNRLYQETGEPRLAAASRGWFEQALDFRQPGIGLAGYRAFWMDDDGLTQSWRDDPGFLEGITGIGLALLGGLSDFEPAWDRIMALSAAAG